MIFSRLTQDLSHRVRIHVSLTKTVQSSHLAQHVTRVFVSELSTTSLSSLSTCTPIRHSSCSSTRPLLTSSSHGDFPYADTSNVSFGPMTETTSPTVFESNDKDLIEVTNIEVKLFSPQTEHNVDLWFSWEHCDSPSCIGFGRRSDWQYADCTAELTGERSKCIPTTSLSIFPSKLSVQFTSLPRKCRETCCIVLTWKKVESRNIFRQRRPFLRTSNSSGKGWNTLQILWSGRSCENSSWRTKR